MSGRAALVAVLVLAGCGESRRAPAPDLTGRAPAASEAAAVPRLPGTIWFVAEGSRTELGRIGAGVRTAIADPNAGLYPSASRLADGRLVAIASRGDGDPDAEQLALVGADGSVERIWMPAAQLRDPAVDPRGRWIVVAANVDGHSDLYRIDLATKQGTRLTDDPAGNFRPAVVGDSIVFVSSRDGDSEIYRMPARGGKAQRLTTFHRDDWEPTPSPDGKTIAFISDREGRPRIFLMSPDGTQLRRLTRRSTEELDEIAPVWSPDGRSLAYIVERAGSSAVWLHDVSTGAEHVLTPPRTYDAEPSFSPDGAWIVVSRGDGDTLDLWALPVGGGEPMRVTSDRGAERIPRWL